MAENRNWNPYHNYSDLEIIKQEALPLLDGIELPDLKRPGRTKFQPVQTFAKYHNGFNTCKDKDELHLGKSFPSKTWKGELRPRIQVEDARLKKDGTPYPRKTGDPEYDPITRTWKYNCVAAVLEPISKDIQSFWACLHMNRQVSTGLTHDDRWVLVGDFDDELLSPEKMMELEIICAAENIPHFTYLERHMNNDHFQVGWILDEPFLLPKEHDLYCACIHRIAELFGSDPNFTGWNIKNPVCSSDNTDTYWYNDTINKTELVKALGQVQKSVRQRSAVSPKHVSGISQKTSRELALFEELKGWYNGQDWNETLDKAKEMAVSISQRLNKPLLPESNIMKQARSVFNWYQKNHHVTKKQRLGALVNRVRKEERYLSEYLNGNLSRNSKAYFKSHQADLDNHRWSSLIPATIELEKLEYHHYDELTRSVKKKISSLKQRFSRLKSEC